MFKLYTRLHFQAKASHFVDNARLNNISPEIQGRDPHGRIITYYYHGTAEKTTKSRCKRISRKVFAYFLLVISFNKWKNYRSISAWSRGRRVDHIYFAQCADLNQKTVEQKPIEWKKFLADKNCEIFPDFALEVMRFADEKQNILPILEKYYPQYKGRDTDTNTIITCAAIEVIELSLGLKLGVNSADDETIIRTFMQRLICRSYHGTRTKFNLLNNIGSNLDLPKRMWRY